MALIDQSQLINGFSHAITSYQSDLLKILLKIYSLTVPFSLLCTSIVSSRGYFSLVQTAKSIQNVFTGDTFPIIQINLSTTALCLLSFIPPGVVYNVHTRPVPCLGVKIAALEITDHGSQNCEANWMWLAISFTLCLLVLIIRDMSSCCTITDCWYLLWTSDTGEGQRADLVMISYQRQETGDRQRVLILVNEQTEVAVSLYTCHLAGGKEIYCSLNSQPTSS